MAKQSGSAVYRVTEVIGTSSNSWEDAAKNAVKTAGSTLRDLRIAEVRQPPGPCDAHDRGEHYASYLNDSARRARN